MPPRPARLPVPEALFRCRCFPAAPAAPETTAAPAPATAPVRLPLTAAPAAAPANPALPSSPVRSAPPDRAPSPTPQTAPAPVSPLRSFRAHATLPGWRAVSARPERKSCHARPPVPDRAPLPRSAPQLLPSAFAALHTAIPAAGSAPAPAGSCGPLCRWYSTAALPASPAHPAPCTAAAFAPDAAEVTRNRDPPLRLRLPPNTPLTSARPLPRSLPPPPP